MILHWHAALANRPVLEQRLTLERSQRVVRSIFFQTQARCSAESYDRD